MSIIEIILKSRHYDLIEQLSRNKTNMVKLSKKTGFTYMHVRNVLVKFQERGLIKPIFNTPTEKRDYEVEMTKKGKITFEALRLIKHLDESKEEDITRCIKNSINRLHKVKKQNGKNKSHKRT